MTTIDQVISGLNSLYGLPAIGLVLGSCIVLGYVLRFIKKFPNDGIPVAVILWGAIAMSLVADSRATSMSLRVWVVRNIMVGMIVGLAAWILHKTLISRLEDWLLRQVPSLGNTDFFRNKPPKPPTDPVDPTPPNP